jgi:hypothetical protein
VKEASFVPADFEVPVSFQGPGFHLEPLAPVHNERDHQAWMNSIEHIRATPGMDWTSWPTSMTLERNLEDMEMHYGEFVERKSFTFSILDGDDVIGCVYIYPDAEGDFDAHVRSWVSKDRAEMDAVVWRSLSAWLLEDWPFETIRYEARESATG